MITDILQKADWSRDSTFKWFYYCPRQNNSDSYGQIVLQQKERRDGGKTPLCLLCFTVGLCAIIHEGFAPSFM